MFIILIGCRQKSKKNNTTQDSQEELAYFHNGNVKVSLQDYRGAIADYDKAIELNPDNGFMINCRAEAKMYLQDYIGAIADYTKTIDLKLTPILINIMAYSNRGNSKLYLQDYRGAINDYNKVIELDPNDRWAYHKRGLGKIMLGQKDSGCLDLSKAGELGLAEAYEDIKKYCK